MNFKEIKPNKQGYRFSCNTFKPRSRYKEIMRMGRVLPSSKAQAKYFISEGICMDILNYDDIIKIEAILNKHGFKGDYKYTVSRNFFRLQNDYDLQLAIKAEYKV